MARKRKAGDIATNARKRYYRAAERYMKQANESSGSTAARYRELARQNLDDAVKTYSQKTTQAFSKPIQKLADQLGINLQEKRSQLKGKSESKAERQQSELIRKSERKLASATPTIDEMREMEARAIINSPIGKRIIGGTVDIWRDAATFVGEDGQYTIDKTRILPALFEYYEVDNLADLIEAIESEVGETLYSAPDSDEMYETVKLTLQMNAIIGSKFAVS